jgi:hypothetical protein
LKKTINRTRGAAMVEFAVILPVLCVLLFGIIEFGLVLYNQAIITNASREGARYAATYYINPSNAVAARPTCAEVQQYVTTYVNAYLITFPSTPFGTSNVICPSGTPSNNHSGYAGYVDTIRIEYQYSFLVFDALLNLLNWAMPGVFPDSLTLRAQTAMRDENQN